MEGIRSTTHTDPDMPAIEHLVPRMTVLLMINIVRTILAHPVHLGIDLVSMGMTCRLWLFQPAKEPHPTHRVGDKVPDRTG